MPPRPASYHSLDQNGTASGATLTQDLWYAYDPLNRVTVSKGVLSGGAIVRGSQGIDLVYNAAGDRVHATTTAQRSMQVENPNYFDDGGWDDGYGGWHGYHQPPYITAYYTAAVREDYAYGADGALASVRIAESQASDNHDGTVSVTGPAATGALKATYSHDLLGRLTRQQDWLYDGSGVAFDRTVAYDNASHVTSETDVSRQGSDTYTSYVSNYYGSGSSYALGAVVSSSSSNYKNGGYQNYSTTTTSYAWYEGAVQSQVDYAASSQPTYHTYYYYNATGALTGANVLDGRARYITVTNDALGQAIRRDESSGAAAGNPHELWYRFNGKQLGYVGNNGTEDTSYQDSINHRGQTPSTTNAFRNGYATSYADFDQNYAPINSYEQGGTGGSYTVRAGDSLGSIAAQLWGDASLWYKLAQANGLGGDSALSAGQMLMVPEGVSKTGNSATTFNPYNAADAYGDTSPTTPAPQAAPKKKGCGILGQILLVVIAVAVTIWASPASPSFWQGALAGLAGSAASQAFGLATGIQDKFDFKGLALSAISGGVTAGLGSAGGILGKGGLFGNVVNGTLVKGALGSVTSGVLRAGLNGLVASALTQGIGVTTGLQSKFDWAGVAAAGIGAAAGSAIGSALHVESLATNQKLGNIGANLVANMAGGVANAATRSLVNGTDFGDNLMAALPDIIGQTVGELAAGTLTTHIQEVNFRRYKREQANIAAEQPEPGSSTAASAPTSSTSSASAASPAPSPALSGTNTNPATATNTSQYAVINTANGPLRIYSVGGGDALRIKYAIDTSGVPAEYLAKLAEKHTYYVAVDNNITEFKNSTGISMINVEAPGVILNPARGGVFLPVHKAVIIGTNPASYGSNGIYTGSIDRILHETGHALDAALGWISQKPAFQAAYDGERGREVLSFSGDLLGGTFSMSLQFFNTLHGIAGEYYDINPTALDVGQERQRATKEAFAESFASFYHKDVNNDAWNHYSNGRVQFPFTHAGNPDSGKLVDGRPGFYNFIRNNLPAVFHGGH